VRLLLGLRRCGRFCMGCFVFCKLGLVGCGLLLIMNLRRLGGILFWFWLLLELIRLRLFLWLGVLRLVFLCRRGSLLCSFLGRFCLNCLWLLELRLLGSLRSFLCRLKKGFLFLS